MIKFYKQNLLVIDHSDLRFNCVDSKLCPISSGSSDKEGKSDVVEGGNTAQLGKGVDIDAIGLSFFKITSFSCVLKTLKITIKKYFFIL